MSEKTTYRTPRDKPYFSINRATAQDGDLSFEARGLLAYLLSKPDDWKVILSDIQNNGSIGRDKARRLLKELESARYIQKEDQTINPDGTFGNVLYRIYETKQKPCTENASTVEASTENPTLHNTESTENRVTEKLFASPHGNAAGEPLQIIAKANRPAHWNTALHKMMTWDGTPWNTHLGEAELYLAHLLLDGTLTPDMDSEQVLVIVKQALIAPPTGPAPEKPMYDKPAKPGNGSDKQYEGLRPTYALNAAVGNPYFPDSDIPKYRKIANHLLENHIPMESFADYVVFVKRYYRERMWEFRWGSLDKGENITAWKAHQQPEATPQPIEDDIEWVLPSTRPVVQYADKPE